MPSSNRWTPDEIRALRERLGMSQIAFGLAIFDHSETSAQAQVSKLENGHVEPNAAVRRTLDRLERGEIVPEGEKS